MTDDFRQLIVAIGRCLIAIAGDDAPAPAPAPAEPKPEPAPMKGKRQAPPRKEKTCIVCGAAYMTASARAMLCPHCRILRVNGNADFMRAFSLAKQRIAKMELEQMHPAPVPDDKIRCERMHATIPADICGTREECHGCKQMSA